LRYVCCYRAHTAGLLRALPRKRFVLLASDDAGAAWVTLVGVKALSFTSADLYSCGAVCKAGPAWDKGSRGVIRLSEATLEEV
jgi:hypothetical protein